jgi:hypothetical protein
MDSKYKKNLEELFSDLIISMNDELQKFLQ